MNKAAMDDDWTLVDAPENVPDASDYYTTSMSHSARLGQPRSGLHFELNYQRKRPAQHGTFSPSVASEAISTSPSTPSLKAPPPPSPQEQSPLLRLPAEIRSYIYNHVFKLDANARMINQSQGNTAHDSTRHSILAFLATCRLVLSEAETIFYSINRLRLDISYVPRNLSDRRRNAIQALEIVSVNPAVIERRVIELELTPNVRSLYITSPSGNISYVDFRSWKIMAPQIATGLQRAPKLEEVKFIHFKGDHPVPHVNNERNGGLRRSDLSNDLI